MSCESIASGLVPNLPRFPVPSGHEPRELSVAAINRLRLTPQLLEKRGVLSSAVSRQLRNNSLIEALGAAVLFLVAVLGTLAPALDE